MSKKNRKFRFLIGLAFKKFLPSLIKKKSIYSHLSFTKDVKIPIGEKEIFYHCHNEQISNSIFYTGIFGDYEGQTIKMWYQISKNSQYKTILDIGAYTGLFSLVAASANSNSNINAYEPNPVTFRFLKKNIDLNNFKNIKINNFGLSDKDEYLEFFNYGDSFTPGMTSVSSKHVDSNLKSSFFETKDILAVVKKLHRKIDLIKLDIERAELPLLHRVIKVINKDRPTIFCEVLDREMYSSFQTFFEEMKYEFIQISDVKKQYFFTSLIINKEYIGRNWIIYPQENKEKLLSIFSDQKESFNII
jgi:FkbM family methyltransferase